MRTDETGFVSSIYSFLFGSPLYTGLALLVGYLIYRNLRGNSRRDRANSDAYVIPPPLEKQNMTHAELKKYDGKGPDRRICVAILGKVIDCTRGHRFYGPNGPYCTFAGRDATRALATFDVNAAKDGYDDVSDLTPSQLSSVQEWLEQFMERYDLVGDLVRPEEAAKSAQESKESDNGEVGSRS